MPAADAVQGFCFRPTPCPGSLPPFFAFSCFSSARCRSCFRLTRNEILSPHLLHPFQHCCLTRNGCFARHILPPISNQKFGEKRKPFHPIFTVVRQWTGCARCRCRPRFLFPANSLPRIASPFFAFSCFSSARYFFRSCLTRNVQPLPLSRGYRGGQRPRRTLKGGQGGTIRRFPLLLSLPFQRERKKHKTIFILVQTHLETKTLLSTFHTPSQHCHLMRNPHLV